MPGDPTVWFLTHPEVRVDPAVPIARWGLSERGRARARRLHGADFVVGARALWSSPETKAVETAELIAPPGASVRELDGLGENDRSATGYLPPEEFEQAADEFFAQPRTSVRGWATAADEQRRIVATVDSLLTPGLSGAGDVVIVAHGAVGALLLCALLDEPVSRSLDQPGQGHYFTFHRHRRDVIDRWRPLEDLVDVPGTRGPAG